MQEYDFNLAKIEYVDLESFMWFNKDNEALRLPPDNAIKASLTLIHSSGTPFPDPNWSKKPIWFRTKQDRQFLTIDLTSPQEQGELPRFYLHYIKFDTDADMYLPTVDHRRPGEFEHKGRPARDKFSEHTTSITLNLRLPGHKPEASFNVKVYAYDRELNRPVNCDPLVGNDPP